MKKKLLITFSVIILSAFLVINIIWFNFINKTYKPFEEIVPLTEQYGAPVHHMEDNENPNVEYGFDYPSYLSFTSNLYYMVKYPNEKTAYTFIVWPKLFSNTKYGVIIQTTEGQYQIELNENMEISGKDHGDDFALQLIKDHEEQLNSAFSSMKEKFLLVN